MSDPREEFEIIRKIAWDAISTDLERADRALVQIHGHAKEQVNRGKGGQNSMPYFDSVIGPAILKCVSDDNELVVRRIWDEVRRASLNVTQSELTAAREEAEKLRGRVSELESWNEVPVPSNIPQARAMALAGMAWLETNAPGQLIQPYVLRKQAEAVESAVEYASGQIDQMGYQGIDSEMALKATLEAAKHYRQQADELENNNGQK